MSSRPGMITYGRSSKKLLARRESQSATVVEQERALPAATPTTPHAPDRKRPRDDDTPSITRPESPRKKAKSSTAPAASTATPASASKPVASTSTVSPKRPVKVTSSASDSRPSPPKRKATTDNSPTNPTRTSSARTTAADKGPAVPSRARAAEAQGYSPGTQSSPVKRRTASTHTLPLTTAAPTSLNNGPTTATPARPSARSANPTAATPTSSSRTAGKAASMRSPSDPSSNNPSSGSNVQADPDNIFFAPSASSALPKRKRIVQPLDPPSASTSTTPQKRKRTSDTTSRRSATPVQDEPPPVPTLSRSPSKPDALSQLFAASPRAGPGTPTKGGGGVAKRMLGRSKTESSLDSGSLSSPSSSPTRSGASPAMLRAYTSLPAIATGSPTAPPSPSVSPSRQPIASTSTASGGRSALRTYANARSFLVQLPAGTLKPEDLALVESQQDEMDTELRAEATSYAALKARWDDDEAAGIGLATDLRSGSEMKNHGETRRFLDDVGYLLEGLESPLLGVQRTSAIELLEKMCDADGEFVRKARSADFLTRAWGVLGEMDGAAQDPILLLCLGTFAAVVSRDSRDLGPIAGTTLFNDVVANLLRIHRDRDVLRLARTRLPLDVAKRLGLKRNEIPLVESIGTVVYERSRLFASSFPVTSSKLASTALAALPQHSIRSSWLAAVVSSAESELCRVSAHVAAHLDGDFMMLDDGADVLPDVEHLRSCVRTLDACLLGDDAVSSEELLSSSRRALASNLVHLCTMCQLLLADGVEEAVADDTIDTTLRVLVNLTNGSSQWCDALLGEPRSMATLARLLVTSHQRRKTFVARSNADEDEKGEADPLDRLCLGLGLLTNLVQESSRTAAEWLMTDIAWTCKSETRCLRDCACADRKNALHLLVRIYVEQSMKTEGDDQNAVAHFLLGHLAVLLALLAHQSAEAAAIVCQDAPLGPLLATCRDWVATFELSRRRLAATETVAVHDSQRGLSAIKRAVEALSATE